MRRIYAILNNKLSRLYQAALKKLLGNKEFTLISNNCWAGKIYEDLNLPYSTPTVGLFFYAPCYINFLNSLEEYLSKDLQFAQTSKYPEANQYRAKSQHFYPIGLLGSVEIHFLHYSTETDAKMKWERRKARINFNKLFVKMCDRDLCTEEIMRQFDKLPYKKVFFSAKKYKDVNSLVYLDAYRNNSCVGDLYAHQWPYRKKFNIAGFITGSKKLSIYLRLLGYAGFFINQKYQRIK